MTSLPAIYIIRASDALQPAAKLQKILQTLKTESRIDDFITLDSDDDLSSLPDNIKKEDLILILLTNKLDPQKKEIENIFKAFRTNRPETRVAEIIVDNVPYENTFITFPADLIPLHNREDMDAAWSSIQQSLMDIFPARKYQKPGPDQPSDNKRLEAVKNHPKYPELLKVKPSSMPFFARAGCMVFIGVLFTMAVLFISFVVPQVTSGFGSSGFEYIILLIFAAVGIGIIIYGSYRLIKLSLAKLRRRPALIVAKRTAVSGGSTSSSSTSYYITVEFSDGERREFNARNKLYGKVTRDDVGVAYIRDRFLLDYRRLTL